MAALAKWINFDYHCSRYFARRTVLRTRTGTGGASGRWNPAASIPLIMDISVAIATTKVPMLLERGFWAAAHEARTDISMLFGLMFLLVVGAGPWSVDQKIAEQTSQLKKGGGELNV